MSQLSLGAGVYSIYHVCVVLRGGDRCVFVVCLLRVCDTQGCHAIGTGRSQELPTEWGNLSLCEVDEGGHVIVALIPPVNSLRMCMIQS